MFRLAVIIVHILPIIYLMNDAKVLISYLDESVCLYHIFITNKGEGNS